jgi:hypothetical protein
MAAPARRAKVSDRKRKMSGGDQAVRPVVAAQGGTKGQAMIPTIQWRPTSPALYRPSPAPDLPRQALVRLAAGLLLVAAIVSALETAARYASEADGGAAKSYASMKGDDE